MGRLLAFEGPDGVGKSTLATALADHLSKLGEKVLLLAFPGNEPGSLGRVVYELHHDLKNGLSSNARQALHVAAHIDAIERLIKPAIQRGETVILDRYWWSTIAYGRVYGANPRLLDHLVQAELEAWGDISPTRIYLIDRSRPFRREGRKADFAALRREYSNLLADPSWQGIASIVLNVLPVPEVVGQLALDLRERPRYSQVLVDRGCQPNLFSGAEARDSLRFSQKFLRSIAPLKPSPVFATYWYFAAERQRMFYRRLSGQIQVTDDPILKGHRFTNAYRAADRVSQYLIRNVAYHGSDRSEELFLRILLFRIFNKIETWERLREELGEVTIQSFDVDRLDAALSELRSSGLSTFSAAYIMPTRSSEFSSVRKHRNFLDLIAKMLDDDLPMKLKRTENLRQAFELLRAYPLLGDFLAYQFTIDLNYSTLMDHDESEFIVAGPGARSGIRKCFESTAGLSEPDIIRLVTNMQSEALDDLGLDFKSLWGRPMHLIDCQNLFCETDKYARLAHPDIRGLGERTRIKQQYRRNAAPIAVWFPPKWGLNERIATEPNPGL